MIEHFLNHMPGAPAAPVYQGCPELLPFIGKADGVAEEVARCLQGKPGFISEAMAGNIGGGNPVIRP